MGFFVSFTNAHDALVFNAHSIFGVNEMIYENMPVGASVGVCVGVQK